MVTMIGSSNTVYSFGIIGMPEDLARVATTTNVKTSTAAGTDYPLPTIADLANKASMIRVS